MGIKGLQRALFITAVLIGCFMGWIAKDIQIAVNSWRKALTTYPYTQIIQMNK